MNEIIMVLMAIDYFVLLYYCNMHTGLFVPNVKLYVFVDDVAG